LLSAGRRLAGKGKRSESNLQTQDQLDEDNIRAQYPSLHAVSRCNIFCSLPSDVSIR
jgi:hypothetical protein